MAEAPIVVAIGVVVAVDEIKRCVSWVCVIGSGFKQKDITIRIFARSARDSRAGTAGANDDDVVVRRHQITPRSFMRAMTTSS